MINLVIVGVGDIAVKRHIPAVLQAKSGRLHGFSSRRYEVVKTFAEKYKVKPYDSYEEVLQDPEVSAVLIATPPKTHADLTVRALQAGKHVLLEKPISLSVEEALQIVKVQEEAAKDNPRPPYVAMLHVQRRYRPHQRAKELLDRGAIGELLTVRTCLGNGDFRLLAGQELPDWQDALFNVGIHRIDLIRWLVGSEITGVCGLVSNRLCPPGSNDHAQALLRFQNGVVGSLLCSRLSFHGEDRSTTLLGTEGTLTTYTGSHDLELRRIDGERHFFDFSETTQQGILELTDLHERFFQSIEKGAPPEITDMDGLLSLQIADAIRRSSEDRRWVDL